MYLHFPGEYADEKNWKMIQKFGAELPLSHVYLIIWIFGRAGGGGSLEIEHLDG